MNHTHQKGVVAAGSQQTVQAGVDILSAGGNAVDAAVGAAFASFVAEGSLVNFCGGGIAQVVDSESGQTLTYDFFSNMSGLGRKSDDRPLDFRKITVDFGATTQDFNLGRGSVAVPGNLFGLYAMHQDFGRMPFKQVMEPAIQLARHGILLDEFQSMIIGMLKPIYLDTPSVQKIYAPNGKYVEIGDRLHIPDLADTFEEIAAEGDRPLRFGRLADAIVLDQETHGGLLTRQDLASYNVIRSQPIRVPYRDYQVLLPPPSSTGGVLTAFALKLLSRFDLSKFKHGSADHLQILTEAMSASTRARPHWEEGRRRLKLDEAIERFLSEEFVADYATEAMTAIIRGRPSRIQDETLSHNDTSHISVADNNGMAVAITTSSGESAGYVVPGTGLIPNNMLGEEDLFPDGFHNYPAGQRIYTMMTPTIVLKDGKPQLVTGSGGSIRIRSAILQIISNVLDFNLSLEKATEHPRIHLERKVLHCEAGTETAAMDELDSLGYELNRWSNRSMYFGGAHSVMIDPNQIKHGHGDSRRAGSSG
ncbi:MAG: gamma-glutamyltranspeptidase/glutathione hydrolase [Cellvibrionaceae bacterium]|jgi:gamma-glutamyltranspeptidase/glutathione hydrolase